MLPVPGISDCSYAECDVDKGRPEATRNVLEPANLVLKSPRGWFENSNGILYSQEHPFPINISMFSDKPPCMPHRFGIVERRCNHIARRDQGFFFFHIFFLSLFFNSFLFLSLFFNFFLFLSLFLPLLLS